MDNFTTAATTLSEIFFTDSTNSTPDPTDSAFVGGIHLRFDSVLDTDVVGDFQCPMWLPINHMYFHIANVFLLLSYFGPPGLYGLLYIRFVLAVGSFFYAVWGWDVLCAFDTTLWNGFFLAINVTHILWILFTMRPSKLDPQFEDIYERLFQPLKVSRKQFKNMVDCMVGIKNYHPKEHYAMEKATKVEHLALVLEGGFRLTQNRRILNTVEAHQFLDSAEWFGSTTGDFFAVTVTASQSSKVLLWHRDKLKLSLNCDPFLQSVLDHILGRDVVTKLMQVNKSVVSYEDPSDRLGGDCYDNSNYNPKLGTVFNNFLGSKSNIPKSAAEMQPLLDSKAVNVTILPARTQSSTANIQSATSAHNTEV